MSNLHGPETQKLQAFFDAERRKGLVDFKVDLADNVDRSHLTIEILAKEINNALEAPSLPDELIF